MNEGGYADVAPILHFYGRFRLPPSLSYTIPIKGEVKRYDPNGNAVGPEDVARLVGRLQRGKHGVFVTSSYLTKQAQEEVYEDRYPVVGSSGSRFGGVVGASRGDSEGGVGGGLGAG